MNIQLNHSTIPIFCTGEIIDVSDRQEQLNGSPVLNGATRAINGIPFLDDATEAINGIPQNECPKSAEQLRDEKEYRNGNDDLSVRALRLVLEKIGLYGLLEQYVHDPRYGQCRYPVASMLMMTVLMHVLRFNSRNAFHDEAKLSPVLGDNIGLLAGTDKIPNAKTFEDLFMRLDETDLEKILPAIFLALLRSKFFQLHPEFKNEVGKKPLFRLAIDGELVHIYTEESQHPCMACPYCLKRTYGNKVRYWHYEVVLSVIGDHGFQFPLFVYRVKNHQTQQECPDDTLKQECELLALPQLLEKFRNEFPKLRVCLLLDSLYANGPAMSVAEQYHCEYAIVRKSGSLSSLNDDIEGLKKLTSPLNRTVTVGQWIKKQWVYVFPDMSYQDHTFTILDLVEKSGRCASSRFAKTTKKETHWQWIVSQQVDAQNAFQKTCEGRSRWSQEDAFNTLQCRGFNTMHDFSRHPFSQSIWRLLMMMAFAITVLVQLSSLGRASRRSVALINWISHLRALLSTLNDALKGPLPLQLRFLYDTS